MSTTYQLDFDEVKKAVSIEKVIEYLGIGGLKRIAPTKLTAIKCPLCGGADAFKVTTDAGRSGTGAFNCFRCSNGGDQLELVSLIRGNPRKDPQGLYNAAKELHARFIAADAPPRNDPANSSPQPLQAKTIGFDPVAYEAKLDRQHEELKPLGFDAETLATWHAGYAKTGPLRGKLALPVTREGHVVAFFARTLKNETPMLSFINGFTPESYIFGEERVADGELVIVGDPLDVIRAYENGETNVVCLLTQTTSAMQLEMIASLMDRKHCDSVRFFTGA